MSNIDELKVEKKLIEELTIRKSKHYEYSSKLKKKVKTEGLNSVLYKEKARL